MKYIKIYEDFDFEGWKRIQALGLGEEDLCTVKTESPTYALGLSGVEWLEFREWAESLGILMASSARGGGYQHIIAWDGPREAIQTLLDKMQELDPLLKYWGFGELQPRDQHLWRRKFKYALEESTDWKGFIRLRELGLSDTEFSYIIITTHGKSLEACLGPTLWEELLEEAKYHGVVRNSFKNSAQMHRMRGDTLADEYWESWIGTTKGIERFRTAASLFFTEANPGKRLEEEVDQVDEALKEFITRWEWAINHDVVLLDDYVIN